MSGSSRGLQDASLGMDSLMLRVLDPPAPSSEDEREGGSSRSEAESSKPHSQRKLKRSAGRMKRTASAPVPPLLSMLSRTGNDGSLSDNQVHTTAHSRRTNNIASELRRAAMSKKASLSRMH